MREVGLRSDQESEEGLKATIHRPELLAGCEGQGEGVDGDEDVDGDELLDSIPRRFNLASVVSCVLQRKA